MKLPRNLWLADEGTRFDRLVDGQLSAEEYRALVASLDEEPGGWRRCALAFLEAQALRQELGASAQQNAIAKSPAPTAAVPATAPASAVAWKHYLAMASSFLIALALGIALPYVWQWDRPAADHPGPIAQQPALRPDEPQAIANARLVVSGPGGVTEAGELPIYELSGNVGPWLDQQASPLPVMLLDELARRGHHVQRQQQLVPVDLGDGRRAVIPVESIEITPVSRRAY